MSFDSGILNAFATYGRFGDQPPPVGLMELLAYRNRISIPPEPSVSSVLSKSHTKLSAPPPVPANSLSGMFGTVGRDQTWSSGELAPVV